MVHTAAMEPQRRNLIEENDWEWQSFLRETDLGSINNQQVSGRRIGVALIGLGRIGLVHLRNCLREPQAQLLYCFEMDQRRLDQVDKLMSLQDMGVQALKSEQVHLALEDARVRAVIVATPTDSHEKLVRMSLEAGKNVMCEKPLCCDTDMIGPLYKLAEMNRVYLLTGFTRRYDQEFRYLHRKRKDLGTLQLIRTVSRDNPSPPLAYVATSGGIFRDTSVHDIDMSLWLAGQLPDTVQVSGKTWQEAYANEPSLQATLSSSDERRLLSQIDDLYLAIVTLKFPNGCLAVIENSRQSSYGYDQRCEVYGFKGMIKMDGRHNTHAMEYNGEGIHLPGICHAFASRYATAYNNELRDLLTLAEMSENGLFDDKATLRKRLLEPLRPTLVSATQIIADACLKAAKTGQTIELKWNDEFRQRFMFDISQ